MKKQITIPLIPFLIAILAIALGLALAVRPYYNEEEACRLCSAANLHTETDSCGIIGNIPNRPEDGQLVTESEIGPLISNYKEYMSRTFSARGGAPVPENTLINGTRIHKNILKHLLNSMPDEREHIYLSFARENGEDPAVELASGHVGKTILLFSNTPLFSAASLSAILPGTAVYRSGSFCPVVCE